MEGGGRDQSDPIAERNWKGKGQILPSRCNTSQQFDSKTSDLQNCRIMHLYCFKPLKIYSKLLQ